MSPGDPSNGCLRAFRCWAIAAASQFLRNGFSDVRTLLGRNGACDNVATSSMVVANSRCRRDRVPPGSSPIPGVQHGDRGERGKTIPTPGAAELEGADGRANLQSHRRPWQCARWRSDGIGDQDNLRRSNADWQLCLGICEDRRVNGYLQRSCSPASFPRY